MEICEEYEERPQSWVSKDENVCSHSNSDNLFVHFDKTETLYHRINK